MNWDFVRVALWFVEGTVALMLDIAFTIRLFQTNRPIFIVAILVLVIANGVLMAITSEIAEPERSYHDVYRK